MRGQGALLDLDPLETAGSSRELVPLVRGVCPACGSATRTVTMGETPLFRHGGYGAMRESVTECCTAPGDRCRWSLTRSVTEVRPPVD